MSNFQNEDEMHQDPNNWKWSCIYYNPNDKRIFLLKKNPAFGITMNFANPKTYLILALIILAVNIGAFAALNK